MLRHVLIQLPITVISMILDVVLTSSLLAFNYFVRFSSRLTKGECLMKNAVERSVMILESFGWSDVEGMMSMR